MKNDKKIHRIYNTNIAVCTERIQELTVIKKSSLLFTRSHSKAGTRRPPSKA